METVRERTTEEIIAECNKITRREATVAEIVEELHDRMYRWEFNKGKARVRFEHGCFETVDCRTESGVRHIRYGRATVKFINKVPHVQHHGKLVRLYARLIGHVDSKLDCMLYTVISPEYR